MATNADTGPGDSPVGLLGVYRSSQDVLEVEDLVHRAGVVDAEIHVGDDDSHARALLSEMQEETREGWVMPTVGVAYPKEAAKGLSVLTVALVVVGALVCLPFGLIEFAGLALWLRLLLAAVVGAALGATIALIVGPAMSVKRSDEPLAADRGIVVRVDAWSPELETAMASHHPIRLDRLTARSHSETVESEELSKGHGLLNEVRRNSENPRMENLAGHTPDGDSTGWIEGGNQEMRPTHPDHMTDRRSGRPDDRP